MSTVVGTFESADGSKQREVGWSVNDLADYQVAVDNGTQDKIIEAVTPMVRQVLEADEVRVISITVDGAQQPFTYTAW
jgi:hypothetical protein